jgi:hypothetical protein
MSIKGVEGQHLALSPEPISSALPEEYESIAEDIYGITGGVPELTEEFLKRMEAAHVFNAADFRASKEKLIKKYYRAYIRKKVLKDLAPTMRETVLALAILQQFDVGILKGILPEVLPRYYQNYGTAEYLNLIENMGSWVQWRVQGGVHPKPSSPNSVERIHRGREAGPL